MQTHIVGVGAPIGSLTDANFLLLSLAEGLYELRAISPLTKELGESIVLQCAVGETHFVRLLYEGTNAPSFAYVDAKLGREDIRERSLRLVRDQSFYE